MLSPHAQKSGPDDVGDPTIILDGRSHITIRKCSEITGGELMFPQRVLHFTQVTFLTLSPFVIPPSILD